MASITTDEIDVKLAKTNISNNNRVQRKHEEKTAMLEEKMEERSKKINAYSQEVTTRFFGLINTPNAIQALNLEAQKLMPSYVKVHEQMRTNEINMYEMDFEALKPLIAFRILQQAMQELTSGRKTRNKDQVSYV